MSASSQATPPHGSDSSILDAAAPPHASSSSAGKAAAARPPQNLRFQRRQSERAFLEGQYRETTPVMEYPSGQSPWASSPEAARTSFGDVGAVPREDLPAPAMQDYAQQQHDGGSQTIPAPHGEAQAEQQAQWQQQGYQGGQQENRDPSAAVRYHHPPGQHQQHYTPQQHQQQQQQQRQHAPQYKLQAKIAGLERTGKKDLILRFDVYVCSVPSIKRLPYKWPCVQSEP